jgi:hypothetical protein
MIKFFMASMALVFVVGCGSTPVPENQAEAPTVTKPTVTKPTVSQESCGIPSSTQVEKYPCVFVEQADMDKYDALRSDQKAMSDRIEELEKPIKYGCSIMHKNCRLEDSPFNVVMLHDDGTPMTDRQAHNYNLMLGGNGWQDRMLEAREARIQLDQWLIDVDIKALNRIGRWDDDIAQAHRLRKSLPNAYMEVAKQENDLSLLPKDTPAYAVESIKLELSTRQASLEKAQAKLSELEAQIYAGNPYKDLK